MRRLQLTVLALVVGTGSLACQRAAEPPTRVFLISIDTLRADHLGLFGYPRRVSPFLDRFGAASVLFADAWASSSHTAPSHASVFTSLHPAQHRLLRNGEALSEQLLTVAEVFQRAGYRTAAFASMSFLGGLGQGFDHFEAGDDYRPAEAVLQAAEAWLRRQPKERRLLVWIHLFDVHEWLEDDHLAADGQARLLSDERIGGSELTAFLAREHGLMPDRVPASRPVAEAVDRYDGQLLHLDAELAGFVAALRKQGLFENSLWLVFSDHGEGLGNHGYYRHSRFLYNEQLRVPIMLHDASGRFRAGRIDSRVRLLDLAPTLAEIIGASFDGQPIPIEGRSLLPLLSGRQAPLPPLPVVAERRPVDEGQLWGGWEPGELVAMIDGRLKLILNTEGTVEVYDIAEDPHELVDLYDPDSPSQKELIERLEERHRRMKLQGELIGDGEIDPRYVEELKALGYL